MRMHAPRCKSSRALSQAQPLSGPKKFRTLRFSRARLASYGACFARVRHENFSRTYRSPPRALRTVASRVRASAPTANPQTSRFSETSSRSSRVAAARSRRDSRRVCDANRGVNARRARFVFAFDDHLERRSARRCSRGAAKCGIKRFKSPRNVHTVCRAPCEPRDTLCERCEEI